MPILDYTGSTTGVFKHIGAVIARVNSYQAVGDTALPADLALLLAAFGTAWLPEEGVAGYYEGVRDTVSGWRRGLASYADRRLLDLETVLRPLGLQPGASLAESLLALRKAMTDDAQTVRACRCGAGAVAYNARNRGTGKAWVTTTLDGFNAPAAGGFADWSYDGAASEMTVPSETMTLECVADSVMDGLPVGGEAWRWSGAPDLGPLDVRAEGSGEGPGVLTGNQGYNLLVNGSLDTWSSGSTPSGWTGGSGASQSGSNFNGAGSGKSLLTQAGAYIEQAVPAGSVQGRRRYFIGFSAYSVAARPGCAVTLSLTGTGFAPGAQARVDGATFSAGVLRQGGAFVTLPSPVPPDLVARLTVSFSGAPGLVWVDDLVMTPAVYHGGVGLAVQGGLTVWQRGDRATFAVTNDEAGKMQNFFRRWFRCQLPSVQGPPPQGTFLTLLLMGIRSQGLETIPESLVA